MEEELKKVLKAIGKAVKNTLRIILLPLLPFILIIILLAGAVYFITVDDGTFKEDDWTSPGYGAAVYKSETTVNADGTISASTSAQEIWDKLVEEGSPITAYLDSAEELAKLMNAEIITQYPDTRSNPDAPIDWDSIINGDSLQGIIKFKRSDENGNKSTMTYVDPETFQGYIDQYNENGDPTAKKNALSHFTIKKASQTTGSTAGINYNGPDLCWPATTTSITSNFGYRPPPVEGATSYHQGLDIGVPMNSEVYACEDGTVVEATFHSARGNYVKIDHGNGYVSWYEHNNSFAVNAGDEVEKGQVVAYAGSTGVSNGPHVHFQIDFNGTSIDPLGFKYNNGMGNGTGGFGVESDDEEDNKDEDKDDEDEDKEDDEEEEKRAGVETPVSGDGYDMEYTSSAGITYKAFKQYQGSYEHSPYWGGDIENWGCGPVAVTILASGLIDPNYTPLEIANEMNEKYGKTNRYNLKAEMDSLGMSAELIENPTAEQIQENLRNGKVMLASLTNITGYAHQDSHIIAIVDINEQGQVYMISPSDLGNGWTDIETLMADGSGKGTQYIVTTQAKKPSMIQGSNTSNYVVQIATWKQIDTTITTNDPNVEAESSTQYIMTTTNVNYEAMVEPYTMPFDYLWALLVVGESKNFVMDIADLVYNSNIEITVHDNLTVNTDTDAWTYTLRTKVVDKATVTVSGEGLTESADIPEHTHDPEVDPGNSPADKLFQTTKTVVTQTNTVNVALTRANVWIVDYQNDFTLATPTKTEDHNTKTVPNEEYPDSPTRTSVGSGYSCVEITHKLNELVGKLKTKYAAAQNTTSTGSGTISSSPASTANSSILYEPKFNSEVNATVKYYEKYINIKDEITHIVETKKYTEGTPTLKEKTDPDSTEPNFVTIFNSNKYEKNSSNIRSAFSWLIEILETNDSTKNRFPELTKYLLYKATGIDYGVTEFDFKVFYPGSLTSVAGEDYVVDINKSSDDIVIRDLETLKKAFSGYSNSSKLIENAQTFLDLQEKYGVNAVFAAAVSISETGAGTAGNAVNGKNNWFNIECTCGNSSHGRYETYSSVRESIEAFYRLIAVKDYYFTDGNYTVSSIGMIYCEDADAPGGWIDNTQSSMAQMFRAAGINASSSESSSENEMVEIAKELHDYVREKKYSYNTGQRPNGCNIPIDESSPKVIDCSAFVSWVLYEYGYTDLAGSQQTTRTLYGLAQRKGWTIKSANEAQPGDIMLRLNYHTSIYAGDGYLYDCGSDEWIQEEKTKMNMVYDYAITVTKP